MEQEATSTLDINDRFAEALALMETTQRSLFITGKAGTGKSTLLAHFCEETDKSLVVLAPTGVAALNVRGQTIHRFFNFSIGITPQKILDKKTKPRDPKLYKKLQTIVIDEVSMLRADLLDCIDAFLRLYGPRPATPFGGVQMIFVGDLYQLPPVVNSEERQIFAGLYASPYFFSAHALEGFELEIVELEKIYRQKEQPFVDLLNRIRNNSVEPEDIERLNSRFVPDDAPGKETFSICLTATNKRADEINDSYLKALPGKVHTSIATFGGEFGKEYLPTATELQLKAGAQIMLLNNDQKRRWVNGSIGVIEGIKKDEDGKSYLNVRLQDGNKLAQVYPHTWEVYRFSLAEGAIVSESAGSFTQYPVRLAWAVTIHKSQGKTFDRVSIDIGNGAFAAGQIYVALSRCTSFEGITLKTRVSRQHIRTDPRIFGFLTGFQYRKAQKTFPSESKIALIQEAIAEKARLEMSYLKANDSKSQRIVIPLTIGTARYQGHDYPGMRAYCIELQQERMFHVDRILSLRKIGG